MSPTAHSTLPRKRLLLTGATGLLGEYLLRDLTAQQIPLVVIARGSRQYSAQQRIEGTMRRWERLTGRALPRPVVLEGNLASDSLGLTAEQACWVGRHCDGIVHNAASLQFVAEDGPQGEPWQSNLKGTHHVLAFAQQHCLLDFFQVSTAYICGTRTGTVYESETDIGQGFGNDYEASKCASEVAIRQQQDRFRSLTFYRPGIITGDHLTGYTSTFHGMYAPMKIVASLMSLLPGGEGLPASPLMQTLGLGHADEKNFVPVDWVSQMIATGIARPDTHHQTYHLTADDRTSCALLTDVIHEEFSAHAATQSAKSASSGARRGGAFNLESMIQSFRSQMEVYRAYWRNDPLFDRTQGERFFPQLPPPRMDRACLKRLCRYALRNNFGWPKPQIRPPDAWASQQLAAGFAEPTWPANEATAVNLRVLGEGGGDFHVHAAATAASLTNGHHGTGGGHHDANGSHHGVGGGQTRRSVSHGLSDADCPQLTLSMQTLGQLARGEGSLRQAIRGGQVVCRWPAADTAARDIQLTAPDWLVGMEAMFSAGDLATPQPIQRSE